PYVNWGKINATLAKGKDPAAVTVEDALAMIAEKAGAKGTRKAPAKKAAKKPAAKKAAPKKAAAKKAS
ncbi:MAG: topoisomerase C-terminal repeat-containing protein, partial [Alphaproteobacteria bacterium]